jgi:hypothetical protein
MQKTSKLFDENFHKQPEDDHTDEAKEKGFEKNMLTLRPRHILSAD